MRGFELRAPPSDVKQALRLGWVGLGDHGPMDVLSSRVLLHPTDPERSRVFYSRPR
jgi:hypothetical protein